MDGARGPACADIRVSESLSVFFGGGRVPGLNEVLGAGIMSLSIARKSRPIRRRVDVSWVPNKVVKIFFPRCGKTSI